ncbi:hypothetical protein FHX59_006496 [Paraburkholderia silvatlantica]|uniref:Uncharacterized protein n=1 Tax=Paraburkholderia silvatlantica TaxID=321895 RepID=A0ABR6FX58_9BURK|nr:hypothetical protein [Paraburkholderia silvatlantica]PVY24696.1 hypothetical protein C7411_12785 [Paraburkholderia silvatlantica]PXW31192.1 hypothetical protein C7413_12685 [Paraburkholderia silvatlantica]
MIGYFFWRKLRFDAPLELDEADGYPQFITTWCSIV